MALRTILVSFVLWLTTASVADAQPAKLVRVTYPVSELVTPIPGRAELEKPEVLQKSLVDVLTKTIAPATWRAAGGQGDLQYFPLGQVLIVLQTAEVHEEITLVLSQLHNAAKAMRKRGIIQAGMEEQSLPTSKALDVKERAIEYKLRQQISLQFKEVPFQDAIKELATISNIAIVIDIRAMKEARVDLRAPVSCSANNVTMQKALRSLLDPLRFRFVIENQVLTITTAGRTGRLTRVTYPIGDLVEAAQKEAARQKQAKSQDEIASVLKTLITNTIAKDSWEEMGGVGSYQYFPLGKALVISQSQEIQEEIQLLLATLRKLHNLSSRNDSRDEPGLFLGEVPPIPGR